MYSVIKPNDTILGGKCHLGILGCSVIWAILGGWVDNFCMYQIYSLRLSENMHVQTVWDSNTSHKLSTERTLTTALHVQSTCKKKISMFIKSVHGVYMLT